MVSTAAATTTCLCCCSPARVASELEMAVAGRQSIKQRFQEYKRKTQQVQALCSALKVESVTDLQDVLGAMVLSECVYKRPESEVLRAVNKFKEDFGGQLISVDRIEASLDHVPHRYVLAEAGDTLFVSFIGTKQYKDVIADANILQRALFGEESESGSVEGEQEQEEEEGVSEKQLGSGLRKGLRLSNDLVRPIKVKPKHNGPKPAAHSGFLARALGVPAAELYRIAQRKDRRLVLCGHSLGGAVAVLASLAILRVFASSSVSRPANTVQIKCITFSQPPVGNAALRDYVHRMGWQQHFRTYCIPEDIVPRILSPAYFQHYRLQAMDSLLQQTQNLPLVQVAEDESDRTGIQNQSRDVERMALGFGPVPSPLWRLPKLVPLAGVQKSVQWLQGKRKEADAPADETETSGEGGIPLPEPLEIQEGTEGVALTSMSSFSESGLELSRKGDTRPPTNGRKEPRIAGAADWRSRVPSLPSYVPFGQLYLLEKHSVEPFSASEYTQLTSVQSVLLELRQRLQSHSMRSYRSRFQQIYNICVSNTAASTVGSVEYLPHLPHLRQWLGVLGAPMAEVGRISNPISIRMATSLVPLGWTGILGEKKGGQSLKVDVLGYGLHLCTLVRAQVNGRWCSTSVESSPTRPSSQLEFKPKLQRMRIRIGAPLPSSQINTAQPTSEAAMTNMNEGDCSNSDDSSLADIGLGICDVEGLREVKVYCSTDFMTVSRNVAVRLRRVRLLGVEGAGKTSLYLALLGQGGTTSSNSDGGVLPDMEWHEGAVGGVGYIDAPGINLQDLPGETKQLKQELTVKVGQHTKKLDLIVLVHNLAHKIAHTGTSSGPRPALALLINEVIAAGVPFILAITNKFAVSADRRDMASAAVMDTYQVPSELSKVVNSSPYRVHGIISEPLRTAQDDHNGAGRQAQRLLAGPMNLMQRPFRKREVVLAPQGVQDLRMLVQTVLLQQEEIAMAEFARQKLALETTKELARETRNAMRAGQGKGTGVATAAAIGAGFGMLVAVIVGAATSLRKP